MQLLIQTDLGAGGSQIWKSHSLKPCWLWDSTIKRALKKEIGLCQIKTEIYAYLLGC